MNDSKLFFNILKGHIQIKYCYELQKCLKSKYAFQFYVRPKHSEMSIIFLRYEPLRLSRADCAAQLTFELPLQCRVRCMAHADYMHTCPLKCVTRNMRWVLPCYSCEAVSHWICDSQFVFALANMFGKSNVPRLVIIEPQ